LFVFLLGPLAPFVLIKFTGKTILYNMCFLGRERPVAVASSIYFLSYLFTVSHAIVPSQNSITAEVVIMWLLLFFRCVTYAAKYGSFPREKVRLYKRQRVPFRDAMADSFLYYYDSQTKHVVYSESWHAFRSHEFEPSMFYLDFFLMPSQEIAEELNQLALDLAEEHRLPEEYQPEPLFPGLTCSFYGFGLLAKFIREFEAEHPRRNLACLGIVVAFLLSVFPLIFRVAGGDGGRWHPDVSPVSILRMIVLILLNTYLSSEALLFLMVGIRDL
jgi:hypothetical protein